MVRGGVRGEGNGEGVLAMMSCRVAVRQCAVTLTLFCVPRIASHCLGLPRAVLPPALSAAAVLIVPLAAAPLPAPVPVLFLSSTLMELKKLSKAAQDLYFNFRVPK